MVEVVERAQLLSWCMFGPVNLCLEQWVERQDAQLCHIQPDAHPPASAVAVRLLDAADGRRGV